MGRSMPEAAAPGGGVAPAGRRLGARAAWRPGTTLLRVPVRTPTWPVASGSLALGFGVAELTGVRAVGGVVLVLGGGWCALRWRERDGTGRAAALLAVYLGAFVASHLLARAIGAWPSVAVVSAVAGGAAYAGSDVGLRAPITAG